MFSRCRILSMKKILIILTLVLIVILVLTLPIADETSDSERVIVDHTLNVIVHPACFDDEDLTNYIDEVSFSNAVDNYEYNIQGDCSKERLKEGKTSILKKILDK